MGNICQCKDITREMGNANFYEDENFQVEKTNNNQNKVKLKSLNIQKIKEENQKNLNKLRLNKNNITPKGINNNFTPKEDNNNINQNNNFTPKGDNNDLNKEKKQNKEIITPKGDNDNKINDIEKLETKCYENEEKINYEDKINKDLSLKNNKKIDDNVTDIEENLGNDNINKKNDINENNKNEEKKNEENKNEEDNKNEENKKEEKENEENKEEENINEENKIEEKENDENKKKENINEENKKEEKENEENKIENNQTLEDKKEEKNNFFENIENNQKKKERENLVIKNQDEENSDNIKIEENDNFDDEIENNNLNAIIENIESSINNNIQNQVKLILEKENDNYTELEQISEYQNIDKLNYNLTVFDLINKIRQNPSIYAKEIENNIQYIKEEKEIIKNSKGEKIEKIKRVFKKKIKVALLRGEIAFKEAADFLKRMKPVRPLIFSEDILINLPETKEEIKDVKFLKKQAEKKKENSSIEIFFKDLIKDPYISVLLMIVDDSHKNAGKKRECILNPEYKYIGINSKFIGKTFIAYFSFGK